MQRDFFLRYLMDRTAFIRIFYEGARVGFIEIQRKIQDGESPFDLDDKPYSDEPPHLDAWLRARDATLIVGETCVSMLSTALKLFVTERLRNVIKLTQKGTKVIQENGVLRGYRKMLAEAGCSIEDAPVNYTLLEEIDLVRNHAQHPDTITDITARFSAQSLRRVPSPIFVSNDEAMALMQVGANGRFLYPPEIEVTPEKMEQAIAEVERFCEWFDNWVTWNTDALHIAAHNGDGRS